MENRLQKWFCKMQTTCRALKFVASMNKKYLCYVFLGELITSLKIIPYMFLLKTAVNLLTELALFEKYASSILALLILILAAEIANAAVARLKSNEKAELDFMIQDQIILKNDSFDYYTLSTKEFFLLKNKAMDGYKNGCIENNISYFFSILSNIVLLFSIFLTIFSLGFTLLLPIGVTIVVRIISEYFDRKANYIRATKITEINRKSKYLHNICENLRYAKEIRTFHLDTKFNHKLEEVFHEKKSIWKKYMLTFRYSSATYLIAEILLQLAIYLILAYRVIVLKSISIGDFIYFFAAYQQIQEIVGNLASYNLNILLNANYLQDFMDYWYTQNGQDNDGTNKIGQIDQDEMVIEFHNVSFRYPNTDFDAITNLNLTLKKGEAYLIVGKNGAGKSTFVKLLCGFYIPTTGEITLNGIPIDRYDKEAYRSLLGVLFQDYKTLNLTIKDNIASLEDEYDPYILKDALQNADLDEKIDTLPEKENTSYSKMFDKDGIELSGGEIQKMMIAKTLYKKASIRIFDEPTASLDAVAEAKIYKNIKKTSASSILIYITHRLSTGVHCDNILVFCNGRIAEQGNHRQLMELNGVYAELFHMQANLYGGEKLNEN